MKNFADGFDLGRVCLVLGIILMAWGACREPMMPTRTATEVPSQVEMEGIAPVVVALDDEMEENVPVIALHGEKKRGH